MKSVVTTEKFLFTNLSEEDFSSSFGSRVSVLTEK